MRRKRTRIALTLAVVALASLVLTAGAANAQTVVYQDNFDNDGIDVNTGIGGGLEAYNRQGGPWLDNGDLDFNRTGNNDRGNVYSVNSFDLSDGFKLEVSYTFDSLRINDANRICIGLIDELPAVQDNSTYVNDFLNRSTQDKYGIGMNLTNEDGSQGFNFATDSAAGGPALTSLSNAQTITTGTHSFVLEVDSSSNWSYSIDGAPATTGTIDGSGFDFARDYQFFTYGQDNHHHLKIQSVTLTSAGSVIPDIPGDANRNGFVDDTDLAILLGNWESEPLIISTWSLGNFTEVSLGDTDVNDSDLAVLLGNWTGPPPPGGAAVPEPATLALLGLGGLMMARRRRCCLRP